MKKSRKLLVVSMVLMQLALAFSVAKASTAPVVPTEPDNSITICCDVPPIDII